MLIPDPETTPDALVVHFGRHPGVHPYGLGDVDDTYWAGSTWWRRGHGAVGIVAVPDAGVPIVYAVAAPGDEADTGALLVDLAAAGRLPEHVVATGPVGMVALLADHYRPVWASGYAKLRLAEPAALPPPDPAVEPLTGADVDDVLALLAAEPDHEGFFVPGLLGFGHHHGLRVDGTLVAMSGVHVLSERFGVAAVGNVATHPRHRRRGFARRVVATQCHGLLAVVPVVGLNVADDNPGARRFYEAIGFRPEVRYDEAELVRIPR